MSDKRVLISGDLLGKHVGDAPYRKLHVGLSGTQEYVTYEDVFKDDVAYLHGMWPACGHCRQDRFPFSFF